LFYLPAGQVERDAEDADRAHAPEALVPLRRPVPERQRLGEVAGEEHHPRERADAPSHLKMTNQNWKQR